MHVFYEKTFISDGISSVLVTGQFYLPQIGLAKREGSLSPLGRMVAVNGHKMSVFVRGQERPLPFYILKTCMMGFLSSIRQSLQRELAVVIVRTPLSPEMFLRHVKPQPSLKYQVLILFFLIRWSPQKLFCGKKNIQVKSRQSLSQIGLYQRVTIK